MATGALSRIPPNVLEEICWSTMRLPRGEDGKAVGCSTVSALARTCRLFHDPALNVLWYSIPDLSFLLFALPKDAYHAKTPEQIEKQYMFSGDAPQEADLQRLLFYARRVRTIRCSLWPIPVHTHGSCAAPEAYDALAAILGDCVLFPNVELIYWHRPPSVSSTVFRSFHILFGPKVHELLVTSRDDTPGCRWPLYDWQTMARNPVTLQDGDFAAMMQRVKERLPSLRSFTWNMDPASPAMARAASAALSSGFEHLAELSLPVKGLPIGPDAFVHLGSLPTLHNLRIGIDASSWTDSDLATLANGRGRRLFPELHALDLTAPTLPLLTSLLACVSSPVLRTLEVRAVGEARRHELDAFFSVVTGLPARENISTFEVHEVHVLEYDGHHRPVAPEPISEQTLAPLFCMRGLTVLMLDIHCPVSLDDAFLEKLARNWPKLTSLGLCAIRTPWGVLNTDRRLGGEPGAPDDDLMDAWTRPRATLLGLIAFARHCPDLEFLGLEFDGALSALPPRRLEQRPGLGTPPRPLCALSVGLSPIEDPFAVAAFLSDVYPWIEHIQHRWALLELEDDPDAEFGPRDGPERADWLPPRRYGTRWERACGLISKFALVRKQERARKREGTGAATPKRERFLGDGYLHERYHSED